MPSRLSCTHTLSAPYTPKLSTCTLAISTLSTSSRTDRADGGRRLAVVFGEVVPDDVGGCGPVERAVCSVVIVEVDEAVVAEGAFGF